MKSTIILLSCQLHSPRPTSSSLWWSNYLMYISSFIDFTLRGNLLNITWLTDVDIYHARMNCIFTEAYIKLPSLFFLALSLLASLLYKYFNSHMSLFYFLLSESRYVKVTLSSPHSSSFSCLPCLFLSRLVSSSSCLFLPFYFFFKFLCHTASTLSHVLSFTSTTFLLLLLYFIFKHFSFYFKQITLRTVNVNDYSF